jgi:hypothetical protein
VPLSAADQGLATEMIEASDDDAATSLWNLAGGAELKKFELAAEAAEERARKRRGLREQQQQDEVGIGIFRRRVD